MSSLSPLSASNLQNTVNASQQQINNILKTLQTGLAINSSADDPASLYISENLNAQALDAASTSTNAQNGLSYLQTAQKAYDNIVTELETIKLVANTVLGGSYTDTDVQIFQEIIAQSVNKIKDIEENTYFNGVQVFNNENSAGLVNEHLFAITSKTTVIMTTVTTVVAPDRGTDYSSYLPDSVNRYTLSGGILTNGVDANLTVGANVITISTAAELVSALDNQNSAGKTYVLLENIDLSTLGTKNTALLRGTFQGTLLGNGYEISGLNIASSTADNVGLFEQIGASGVVKDLILNDFTVDNTGHIKAGSLAGTSAGNITNVAVLDADVTGNTSGGLVGANTGIISKAYTTGTVGTTGNTQVGGLAATNSGAGNISDSFSTADVTGDTKVGGLVGVNQAIINKSYTRGNVVGNSIVGGLVGSNDTGTISNTYSLGDVSGSQSTAGLVGENKAASTITNSYSISDVTDTEVTHNIANYTVSSTGSTVAGISMRPNDTYNLVYDYGGKTLAFASEADYNSYVGSSGAIGQFYELTDALNNTWTGKTQTAGSVTYTPNVSLGSSVSNLPDIAGYGTIYNGTIAFANSTDRDNYVNGTGEVSLYYSYNSGTDMWDAKTSALVTSTVYDYTATYQGSSIEGVAYRGDTTAYTYKKTVGGPNAGTYFFYTQADSDKFNDGVNFLGDITNSFYKLESDPGMMRAYSVSSNTLILDPSIYHSATYQPTGFQYMYEDDYANGLLPGGYFAFNNSSDSISYWYTSIVGSNSYRPDFYYYKLNADGFTFDYMKMTSTGSPGPSYYQESNAAAPSVAGTPNDPGYTTLSGSNQYAFASAGDMAKFNGGTPTGSIAKYYTFNSATDQWDAKQVTQSGSAGSVSNQGGTLTGLWQKPNVAGYSNLLTIAAGANAGSYAFDSAADKQSFVDFNAGLTSAAPIGNYYKMLASTAPDPITGKLINQWGSQSLTYDNDTGFLVGDNAGTVTGSAYGTGNASESYVGDDGVQMLGNAELASQASVPLNTWSGAIWDFTGPRPTLKGLDPEGTENIDEGTLPSLSGGGTTTTYAYTAYEDFNTTDSRLNVALIDYSNTFAVAASQPGGTDAYGRPNYLSYTFANNKLIANMRVSNSADANQVFTEGKDFVAYTNDGGATWKMDILSDAMLGKNIKVDYDGVPTGTANQAITGFSLYMGNNTNVNVRDMVLDFAGRLNFDLTNGDGAHSILESVASTLNYMKIKDIQLGGDLSVAAAALTNKNSKTTAISGGSNALISVDEAKQRALLAKKQINSQMVDDMMNQFYSLQISANQLLMGGSGSSTDPISVDSYSQDSTASGNSDLEALQALINTEGFNDNQELRAQAQKLIANLASSSQLASSQVFVDYPTSSDYSSLGLYSGLIGVNNTTNKNVTDYYYKNLYDTQDNPENPEDTEP